MSEDIKIRNEKGIKRSLSFANESELSPPCPSQLRVSAIEGEPSTAWAASVVQVALDRA